MNPYLRIAQPRNDLAVYYSRLILGKGHWIEEGISTSSQWPAVRIELIPIFGFNRSHPYARAEVKLFLGETLVATLPTYKWLQINYKGSEPASDRYTFVLAWKPSPDSQELGPPSMLKGQREPNTYAIFSGIIWFEAFKYYKSLSLLLDDDTAKVIDDKFDQAYDDWIPEFPDDPADMIPALHSAMAPQSRTKSPDNLIRVWMRCDMTDLDRDSYIDIAFLIDKDGNKVPVFLPGEKIQEQALYPAMTLYFDAKQAVEAAIDLCPARIDIDEPFLGTAEKGLKAVQEALERFGVSV